MNNTPRSPDLQKRIEELKVLVVDDSEFDRLLLQSILIKNGVHHIQLAEDGGIALNKLENALAIRQPFDVVFLDWKMPQNGMSLVKKIRHDFKLRSVSVVITTGTVDKKSVQEFITLGINDFIVKPVTTEVIDSKITGIAQIGTQNVG